MSDQVDPSLIDTVLPVDEQGYPEEEMLADREPGVLFGMCGAASRKRASRGSSVKSA